MAPTDQIQAAAAEDEATSKGRRRPAVRWLKRLAGFALTLIILGCLTVLILPPALGLQRFIITGSSMSGSIEKGSLAFTRAVPVKSLEVGDVITYTPPGKAATGPVTHRITWVGRDSDGRRAFRTKGDANEARDPWTFNLDQKTQAQVEYSVPYVGYAMAAMAVPSIRMIVLVMAALIFMGSTLRRLWREAGEESRGDSKAVGLRPSSPEAV